jgi:alpha-glucosidase
MSEKRLWWERGVIYQVYPRSFQDSNGDGVGDLGGILARLDYLQWLGVDALWVSPVYPSPMKDFGYDVSNYTDIHPVFGTLADLDALVADLHRRGMRLILDFVPNHTSDRHPWFIESRASRHNPRREWYIWRDPAPGGGPPNNWLSNFGGSAWEFDGATGQYYYHAFLKEQPDLNWRNREVRQAMYDVLRFWLDRGIDGFRIDVIYHIVKDEHFRDNPPNPDYEPGDDPYHEHITTYNVDRPEVHDIIAEMRSVLDGYRERMMIGEIYLPVQRLVAYYGAGGRGAHLPFNFQLITLPWHARVIAETINSYEACLPDHGWPNWVLGNHDKPRLATRIGPAHTRVAAMLLLTLRGTPTLYYGDELGMHNVPIPPSMVRDPFELNVPGLGLGRDPCRTPMQWEAGPNAGFSTAVPWLPLARDYETVNVAVQRQDPRSLLTLYHELIAIRRCEPALTVGSYAPLHSPDELLAYLRRDAGRQFAVILNFGASDHVFEYSAGLGPGTIALSTHLDRSGEAATGRVMLRAHEGVLIRLGGPG